MAHHRSNAVLISFACLGLIWAGALPSLAAESEMLIDDFRDPKQGSHLGTRWRGFSDRVMGGVSEETVSFENIDGRDCLRLTGEVRLENNGGFIQAALDFGTWGRSFDASAYTGLRLKIRGNGEDYSVHLRTPDNTRPWQSYRAHFSAGPDWQTVELPFADFQPYRLETPLDRSRLRRIGLVAIGREFSADLAVCEISFY